MTKLIYHTNNQDFKHSNKTIRLQKKGLPNRIEPYWICQIRNGAFPTKLKKLIKERERYQQLVNQELAK